MHSYLIEYYKKCKSKEIIIGKELMAQLEILMNDMDSSSYRFDVTEAHKRIKFIEHECKHSISPFAGAPFLLELWQKAFLEAKYSFYMEIEGKWLRRFNRTLLLIGRKNGKTTLCAADSLAEFFCGNVGTNILCASNDYEQAGLVFDEINNMREESPKLEKVSRKNIKGIFMGNPKQKKKKGKFSKQNKAKIKKLSVKTGAKEGKNVDKAVIDEVHEMEDNSLVAPIVQSTSTKDEAMIDEISTEGFTQDGYLDGELKEARLALKGELHRPRTLYWLYTQDSEIEIWQDRSSWPKSNPNLGIAKKWHYLDGLIEEAKTNSATRAFMLAKDFNIKQSNAQAWMQQSDILNTETFDLKDFVGGFYISGNDFAETTDLCASRILLKKPNDKKTYLYSRYWIPESKLENAPDDVDYREWESMGLLTIVPGNVVTSSLIADWHFYLLTEYDLKPFKSGYDNRFAKDFQNKYIELFGEKVAVNIPQEAKVLNNPMRTLEADLRDKTVIYNNNPMDFWCFCNTGIKLDTVGRIMPCKMHPKKKIDGTATAVICYATLEWFRSEFMSLIG
ncbi:MAG: phage Terminase [Clostridia bacterium]|jgi:phage terminase large subunit-like protein|nr:phage Terminase [Clostridia bacterium]